MDEEESWGRPEERILVHPSRLEALQRRAQDLEHNLRGWVVLAEQQSRMLIAWKIVCLGLGFVVGAFIVALIRGGR